MASKERWYVKNIFSIITLVITFSGLVAGYTRLQITVESLKTSSVSTDTIRKIMNESLHDKLALINKDIKVLETSILRNERSIRRLGKFTNTYTNSMLLKSSKSK